MMIWISRTLSGKKEGFKREILDLFNVAKMQHKSQKFNFSSKIQVLFSIYYKFIPVLIKTKN